MKRPSGTLHEEFSCSSMYFFDNGELDGHHQDTQTGEYTGRFWFEYLDGSVTKAYTANSAPKWLHALHGEATGR